jgi:hypothetical protein
MRASGNISMRSGIQSRVVRKTVIPVIDALRMFLSFAMGEWMPPMFIVGSNSYNPQTWTRFTPYEPFTNWNPSGWLDMFHGEHLELAYPGFCRIWNQEEWQSPLTEAITWLIQASRHSNRIEGAIAFSQIPLEMLASVVFVDQSEILDSKEFDKLSAGNNLQLLLHECRIPADIPPALASLLQASTNEKDKSVKSGPRAITDIRNIIIHPHRENKDKFKGWVGTDLKAEDVLRETQQLFNSYITLVLLWLMDYQGKYANRVASQLVGVVEKVPLAK